LYLGGPGSARKCHRPRMVSQRDNGALVCKPGIPGTCQQDVAYVSNRLTAGTGSAVLLLLASNASSFITGQTLAVDGGASTSAGLPFMTDEMFKLFAEALPDGLGQRIMPS
jgi:hypothetical protein